MTIDATATTDLWIRRFHPKEDTARFVVCFSHAGGSASYFYTLSSRMPAGVELLAVQYPGRHDRYREPAFRVVESFAEPVAEALGPYLRHPVTFFGHSLGALVGFEVAVHLESAGHRLSTFMASGRRAPSTWRDESPEGLDDRRFIAEIRNLDGTDGRVFDDPDLVRMVLPTLRGDYTAAANYRCDDTALNCPVVVVVGDDDPKCSVAEARAWSRHANGGFRLVTMAGGHFYLDQHQDKIVSLLASEPKEYHER